MADTDILIFISSVFSSNENEFLSLHIFQSQVYYRIFVRVNSPLIL